ncbi:hypothetical protein VCHENC01_2649 [Vibrio harveyi]|nr:hypothetical protein VCHENC01_2649 [Vibrio harveyi]
MIWFTSMWKVRFLRLMQGKRVELQTKIKHPEYPSALGRLT